MKVEDFDLFANLVRSESGLVLSRDKAYLLETRLMPVARKHGLKGLEDLAATVRSRRDRKVIDDITEAMTTNESLFFRDSKPFDQFRDLVLPALLEKRVMQKRIRIWSAASSSGQEPYSLAMILKEQAAKWAGWRIEILGTDISREMLEKAQSGLYTQFEVQRGLPITLLVKYFKQIGDKWQLDPAIRAMVQYKFFNLLEEPTALGKFDVVYCRNVLIYFDQDTKRQVLERIAKLMPDDGILYLGGAETVLGVTDKFAPVTGVRGMYRLAHGEAAVKLP